MLQRLLGRWWPCCRDMAAGRPDGRWLLSESLGHKSCGSLMEVVFNLLNDGSKDLFLRN